jgi:hypothetical protein
MPANHRTDRAFASDAEEREFWERTDSADEIDWSKAEDVRLPNLEPRRPGEEPSPKRDVAKRSSTA